MLKNLRNLLTNKIGILLAIIQLILFWYASTISIGMFDSPKHEVTWEVLFIPVFIINLPAIISAYVIFLLASFLIDERELFTFLTFLTYALIVFQWLVVGKLISNFFSYKYLKELSLEDD